MWGIETNRNINKEFGSFEWELEWLKREILDIKKESFKAKEELKAEIKRLWFYDWDENWENISFNIDKIKEYLQRIKDKSWTDLDVKSSELEKWVRTIAIQLAINYINMQNWESTNNIDWIDGIRGNKTWKWIKEFQIKYGLINKDGLPWRETINKILNLLGSKSWGSNTWEIEDWWDTSWGTNTWNLDIWSSNALRHQTSNPLGKEIDNTDDKYVHLLKTLNFNTWKVDSLWIDFKNRLNNKFSNKWGVDWIIFNNSGVQTLLASIVDRQWQEINNSNRLYQKKIEEEKLKAKWLTSESLDHNEEAVQSLEDYKYINSSPKSFEEFVLSDEWIAIVRKEIQSHIDTSHKNENGEYNKFYENYPISEANLHIKLSSAWKSKILNGYYKESGICGYDEQLSEEERKAKEEEMEKLDAISNEITWYVDRIVWEYMKSGKEDFDGDIIWELELLLSKWANGLPISELSSDEYLKDIFKEALREKIKDYWMLVSKGNDIDINTWDKQIDLQLKSYLYIYWRIFYSKFGYFESNEGTTYYEKVLPDIMRIIIFGDNPLYINIIKNKKLLELERKLEEERKKRDLQRRQEAARKNRERNNRSYGWNWWKGFNVLRNGSDDINEATWAEIVREYIDLSDIKPKWNIWETILDSWLTKQKAFWIAWANFKKSNIWIENIVTPENMRDLYNVESNDINENARKSFLDSDIMQWRSQEDIDKIYNVLKSFSSEFLKAIKIVTSWAHKQEEVANEETKIHALWEVIDNVRDIFDIIVEKRKWDSKFEWFKFDKNDPVRREWDNIIMSGTFNWATIKIRYDLNSWELFINSFLQTSPWKIIIWNNTDINIRIWELDSFDTILNKHYRAPDISLNAWSPVQHTWNQAAPVQNPWANQWATPPYSLENSSDNGTRTASQPIQPAQPPVSGIVNKNKERIKAIKEKYEAMLYAKIDMIGDKIMENTKKQSAINSSVTKFMKTFNIITEWQEGKTIEFNDWGNWSDLFDFLEIISNSNPDTLDKFQLSMKELVERSWFEWWSNNVSWPQMNSKSKETFDDNNKNENISLLRECRKDFSAKSDSFVRRNPVFESGFKFWFAQLVKENFINKSTRKPNRELDENEMRKFFTDAWLDCPFG